MASCFDTLVGLSNRTCDCYEEGRPAGGAGEPTRQEWKYQTVETGASPANPLIISTIHPLPETLTAENLQLFEAGATLDVDDLTRQSDTTLSVPDPAPNTTYQLWFLSETTAAEFTPAYNQSTSGLFLSDLLPEEEIQGLVNCDNTVWDAYTDARRIAVKEFAQSLNVHVLRRHQVARKAFSGYLGESTNDGTLSTAKTYAGLRIRTNPVKSGYLRISRIMAMFSATGTVPITIYDGDGTVTVKARAGAPVAVPDLVVHLAGEHSEAAVFVCVDAVLAAFPRATVVLDAPPSAVALAADPRVRSSAVPDARVIWRLDRPVLLDGVDAFAERLAALGQEEEGRLRVRAADGTALGTAVARRARRRADRWGPEVGFTTGEIVASGIHVLRDEPHLEAWVGGWGGLDRFV